MKNGKRISNSSLLSVFSYPSFTRLLLFISCVTVWFVSGCQMTGKAIDTTGTCWHPQLASDGSQMGIVYYHQKPGQSGPEIRAVKVDKKGTVTQKPKTIITGPLSFNDGKYTGRKYTSSISNMVWNPTSKQFAFAYCNDYMLWMVRLDSNLNKIGSKSLMYPGQEHLSGLSLAWNSKANEYCLTYIIDPPLNKSVPGQWKESNLRCILFSPGGNTLYNSPKGISLKRGTKHSFGGTSVVYNPQQDEYALAYHDQMVPRVYFLQTNGTIKDDVKAGSSGSYKYEIHVSFNPKSNEYLVTDYEYGGHLRCQRISQNHKTAGGIYSAQGSYWPVICVCPHNVGGYRYLFCAAKGLPNSKRQIVGWSATDTKHINQNFIESSTDKVHKQPSMVILPDGIYMAWIQDNVLYFDNPRFNMPELP